MTVRGVYFRIGSTIIFINFLLIVLFIKYVLVAQKENRADLATRL